MVAALDVDERIGPGDHFLEISIGQALGSRAIGVAAALAVAGTTIALADAAPEGEAAGAALVTDEDIISGIYRFAEAPDLGADAPRATLLASGVIGGDDLNVADFQIATSLRLAMSLDDLRPAIEHRPAGKLALRVVQHYPGRVPPVLPAAWLEPLAEVEVDGDYGTLITQHHDRPGIIAKVSTILALHQINIAFMKVFRHTKGETASLIVQVDGGVSDEALSEVEALPSIDTVKFIKALGAKHD